MAGSSGTAHSTKGTAMAEAGPEPDAGTGAALPQATVVPRRRARISVVWIVPVLAALVAVGVAVQRLLSAGPTITIVLADAEGIEAGKTFIKYKDVKIGQVTAVDLAEDYRKVTLTARMARSAAGLMVEDARFWVVEPRITLSGVSGLSTLLSGNYIGFEAGKSTTRRRDFVGLDEPPVLTEGKPGRMFALESDELGSLGVGAPVYFRSLPAGQVVSYQLSDDGRGISIKVFVDAPFDKYVMTDSRFWNASGIDVRISDQGMQVHTESLAALIAGGLAFDTPASAESNQRAEAGARFSLFGDRAAAMKQPDILSKRYVLYFDGSLHGLAVGAPVTVLGLAGGEVTQVGLDIDAKAQRLRGRVEIVTFPQRLTQQHGVQPEGSAEALAKLALQRQALLEGMVDKHGLRAQLRSASLLTGQQYVAFDFYPGAPPAKVDWSVPKPVLPVVPSPLPDIEAKVASILNKIDSLPFAALGQDSRQALASLDRTLKSADTALQRFDGDVTPALTGAIAELKRAAASADTLMRNADGTLMAPEAPAQQALLGALQELTRAARSVRVLTDYLEQNPQSLIRGKTQE